MKEPKLKQRLRDGTWTIEYHANGKRKYRSLKTKDKIEARLQFVDIVGLPSPITQNNTPVAINSPVENGIKKVEFYKAYNAFFKFHYGIENAWADKPKGQCTHSSTVMRGTLKGFRKMCKPIYLSDIRFIDLQDFANLKRLTCTSNASINSHIQRIRRFLQFCLKRDWLMKNEADKWDHLPETTPERYKLTDKELKLVWKNMQPQFLPYYKLMFETGLRACDMWGLTRNDFRDEEEGMELHLRQGKTKHWLRVPLTKKATRIVNSLGHRLFPWADKSWWLERELSDQRKQCINALWMCFGDKHTGPGSDDWGQLERGKAYCKPNNIRQHTIRHTFAFLHLNSGTPLEALKDLMGHRDIRMTQVYADHMTPKTLRQYVK